MTLVILGLAAVSVAALTVAAARAVAGLRRRRMDKTTVTLTFVIDDAP